MPEAQGHKPQLIVHGFPSPKPGTGKLFESFFLAFSAPSFGEMRGLQGKGKKYSNNFMN